jgi:hypothetical protein
MNAVDRFTRELETLLSDIAFSGLKNIHPAFLEKLTLLENTARELGMENGAVLLGQFSAALRQYRLGSADAADAAVAAGSPAALLCGLEFYGKNLAGNISRD